MTVNTDVNDVTDQVSVSGSTSPNLIGETVVVTVKDQTGNTVTASAVVQPGGVYDIPNLDVAVLVDGPLTITVTGTPPGGSPVTVSDSDTLDAVTGAVAVTTTVDNGNAQVDVSGTTTDVLPGQTVAIKVTDVNGQTVTATATVQADGTYAINNIDASGLTDGQLITEVTAVDNNGNPIAGTDVDVLNAINDAPTLNADTASTNEDTPVNINVLVNDSDVDGDSLTVTGATVSPAQGTVVVNSDGSIKFTPAANYNGSALVTYTVADGNGGVSTSTVNVTIVPTNDAPTDLIPTVQTVSEHAPAGTVVATFVVVDADLPNDQHTFAVTGTNAGLFTINPTTGVMTVKNSDGLYLGCGANGQDGSYVVEVTVTDAAGASYTESVTINVTNILEAPVKFCDPCSKVDLVVKGYDNHDYIQTGYGDDTVYACNGNDTVITNCGDDVVYAGGGNDKVCLGSGNDTVYTGSGADTVDGGCGTDTASYIHSAAAVTVSLDGCTVGKGGDAEGDRLYCIENLIGSNYDDKLSGSGAANVIDGGAGNDTISGSSCDTIMGGVGNDVLIVNSSGINVVAGGAGIDTLEFGSMCGLDMTNICAPTVTGIEFVDMKDGCGGDWLKLTSTSLDKMIDTNILYVNGDAKDTVYLKSDGYSWEPKDWVQSGTSVVEGVTYNSYMSDNNQLVMIESGVGVYF